MYLKGVPVPDYFLMPDLLEECQRLWGFVNLALESNGQIKLDVIVLD